MYINDLFSFLYSSKQDKTGVWIGQALCKQCYLLLFFTGAGCKINQKIWLLQQRRGCDKSLTTLDTLLNVVSCKMGVVLCHFLLTSCRGKIVLPWVQKLWNILSKLLKIKILNPPIAYCRKYRLVCRKLDKVKMTNWHRWSQILFSRLWNLTFLILKY